MSAADTSLSIAQQVDAVCDLFETQWRSGQCPRIEDHLATIPESTHNEILRALIPVELELLGEQGNRPAAAEYHLRFPNHKELISEIFARLNAVNAGVAETSVSIESINTPVLKSKTSIATQIEPALVKSIGRFQVVGVLGEGAFGRVYRAKDLQLARDVAIKVPFDKAVQTEADRERFLREARAAANFQHPNICPVYEVGEADGKPYIVMALIPGESLGAIIKARKQVFPEKQAAVIIRRLALALDAAHSKGVVHRDLKPANVMFDRDRKELVLTDFGLARGPQLPDEQETQSGIIMGTPAYMSPEQARGGSKTVGPAADIYSLGVILYELLTGCRPFTGSTTEVFGQILHVQPQPLSKHRLNIDPRMEAACMKAIAKDPEARFASMTEFAAAMDAILQTLTGSTIELAKMTDTISGGETAPGTDTRRLAEIFAVISEPVDETQATVMTAIPKTRTPRWVFVLAGLFLVGGVAAIAGLVFYTKSDKVKVTVELPDVDVNDKSLSFFLDEEPIAVAALANPIELKPGDHVLIVKRDKEIIKRVLLTVSGGGNPGITTKDITPTRVTQEKKTDPPPPPPIKVGANPLDKLKAADIPDAVLTKIYGGRDKAPQELVAIIKNIGTDTRDRYTAFDIHPDGKVLASAQFPWPMIELRDLTTGKKLADIGSKPTDTDPYFYWLKFSPDGKTLYGVRKDEDLYAFDLQGRQLWRLPMRANFSTPALSPDGSTLIVPEANAESKALRVIDPRTGTERTKWPELFTTATCRVEFSPDGKTLALFTGSLKLIDAADGKIRKKFDGSVLGYPAFSRDGSKVYYSRDYKQAEDHFAEVNLATGETREYRLSPLGCRNPATNPVYPIIVASDRGKDIHFWDADVGPNQKPYTIPMGVYADRYQFTSDGRYCIVGSDNGVYVLRLRVDQKVADWKPAAVPKNDNPGFVPLFNGKDLNGWDSTRIASFSIDAEGNIVAAGDTAGSMQWLLTKKEYANFVLRLEFMIVKGFPTHTNSGVTIRAAPVQAGENGSKLRVHIRNDSNQKPQPGAVVYTGSSYIDPTSPPTPKPAGEWNTMEVEVRGTQVKVSMNGKPVNEVELSKIDQNTFTQKEKTYAIADLERKKGRIGLQSFRGEVKFRNIQIKELDPVRK